MIAPPTAAPVRKSYDVDRAARDFALLRAVYLFAVYVIPKPATVKIEGWRLTGIFLATIVGSVVVYQSVCVSTAVFLTGQASNPLAARFAAGYGYTVTWTSWLVAAIVPRALSLAVIPWRLGPPPALAGGS